MGFFSKITRPFKKAANKVIKPFQKISDKLIPNELRPLLPYASMFLPASGIMGQLGGLGGFGKMYAANMLTQAMGDPEADFEDLNQLSGILSGAQGALSGQYADGTTSGSNLRNSTTEGIMRDGSIGPITPNQNTALTNRSFLTKAADLGKNVAATGSDYFVDNIDTLQGLGSGRSALNLENLKEGAKALGPSFAQATGDVAVNYQRPAMRAYEEQEAADSAEIEATSTADRGKRAGLQMTFMRQAGHDEETIEDTLEMNDLGDLYTPPVETAAYGGMMGRNDYEFGGIIEALKNAESREMMTQNRAMGGMMGMGNDPTYHQVRDQSGPVNLQGMMGYNMGGSVLPQGMEMDYRQGGFIPMGSKERADDVPARVSKNEFVMTADAVRAAGGGSVNQGAKKMYDLMNNLEAKA
jgi:hypothetical protein